MAEQLKFVLKPSLKSLALRKVIADLWAEDDISAAITKFRCHAMTETNETKRWQLLLNKVTEKLLKLVIPETLKSEGMGLIKPIGAEILKWKEYHARFLSDTHFVTRALSRLCWTSLGTVDLKKTAEVLVSDENLDASKRYMLACIYCLEEHIPIIWENISERNKRDFYSEEDAMLVRQQQLVVLWTYITKGDIPKTNKMIKRTHDCSVYQYAFEFAATTGNSIATKYFFEKLTHQEKEECVVRVTKYAVCSRSFTEYLNSTDLPKEYFCDVLCFLLSQMDTKQRMIVLDTLAFRVIRCLLDWPWQDLVIYVFEALSSRMSLHDFRILLYILTVDGCRSSYNYRNLFEEVWLQGPSTLKEQVFDLQLASISSGFFSRLFKVGDEENVKMVLRNASTEQREKLITCKSGLNICLNLVINGEWCLLETFIRECRLSKEVTLKLQVEFPKYVLQVLTKRQIKTKKRKWERFFQLLIDYCMEKRSTKDSNTDATKRLGNKFGEVRKNTEKGIVRKRKIYQ